VHAEAAETRGPPESAASMQTIKVGRGLPGGGSEQEKRAQNLAERKTGTDQDTRRYQRESEKKVGRKKENWALNHETKPRVLLEGSKPASHLFSYEVLHG